MDGKCLGSCVHVVSTCEMNHRRIGIDLPNTCPLQKNCMKVLHIGYMLGVSFWFLLKDERVKFGGNKGA